MDAVVVTGVSSGIGLAVAEDLLARGYRVFGTVRKVEDAEPLTARYRTAFLPLVLDVTDASALESAVSEVRASLAGAGLKALVNNAGITVNGPLMLQPLEEIRSTFDVNVFGLLAVTKTFLPLLGARRDAVGAPGRIVNIGSVSGAISVPFMGAYAASKHAVEALTQCMRRELQIYGIEVAAIEPSFIKSRLFEKSAMHARESLYADSDYAAAWNQFNRSVQAQEAKAKTADHVTRSVRHAIEAKRPRTRYPLDMIWHIGRWLPDRTFDRLIFKAVGIDRLMRKMGGT